MRVVSESEEAGVDTNLCYALQWSHDLFPGHATRKHHQHSTRHVLKKLNSEFSRVTHVTEIQMLCFRHKTFP